MRITCWRMSLLCSAGAHGLAAALLSLLPPLDAAPAWRPDPVAARDLDVIITDIYDEMPPERVVAGSAWQGGAAAEVPRIEGREPGTAAPGGSEEATAPPSSGAGMPGTGTPPPLFPVPGTARSVVFVIDRSGSMGEAGRLALARRELAASLRRLPATTRFQVVVYNRHADVLRIAGRTDLVPVTEAHIQEALQRFDLLAAEGSTNHREALRQALRLQPEVVFFLTDADDMAPADVALLTQLNRRQSAIHVVELTLAHRDRDDMPMHVLARDNGGSYRAVDTDH